MPIQYCNTDLDLVCPTDLAALAAALKGGGVRPLHVTDGADGFWYATFETDEDFHEPEPNIAAMLAVIELLDEQTKETWQSCITREFNIGYDCGTEPWAFNHGLAAELLGRMAVIGAALRITLYPERPESNLE